MRSRTTWCALLVGLALAATACDDGTQEPAAAPVVSFTEVELPAGAAPAVLAAAGDEVLVGTRRADADVTPGLVRLAPDGTLTELATTAASPYGVLATWRSIAVDGTSVFGLGGERGGAHGHVRWSVWTGSADGPEAGLTERVQGFSVFGGYEAGDLVGGVLTPAGPVVVGGWASANVGFDVAVWATADEVDWQRRSSAGTALESTRTTLGFPMNVARDGGGLLVVGWQVALDDDARQLPVVWSSPDATAGWTATRLPDAGTIGAALAGGCWDGGCAVVGRVDGALAVWERRGDGEWRRVGGVPDVPVGDVDQLAAPVDVDGALTLAVADGDRVLVLAADGDTWTTREAPDLRGPVAAVARAGDQLYVVAGPSEDDRALWRTDVASLR